jgi:uncharacterized protein YodC (DUF2158 family)
MRVIKWPQCHAYERERSAGRREQFVVMNDMHDDSNHDEGHEEDAMAFEPGDVVYLKSGSQALTVVVVDEDNIECVWISDSGELFRETIPGVALTKGDLLEDEEDDEARRSA